MLLPAAVAALCADARWHDAGGLVLRHLAVHPALATPAAGVAALPYFLQVNFPFVIFLQLARKAFVHSGICF